MKIIHVSKIMIFNILILDVVNAKLIIVINHSIS